jgi:hypothetical protein
LVNLCVYIEGGGPHTKSQTATACRKAFHLFFEKVLGEGRKPRIIACGSRDEAYRDFCRGLENDADSFSILLVDSEDPVAPARNAVQHLRHREKHWTKPMPDGQIHLMVQCMESWFLADRKALAQYYGDQFKQGALPGNPKIEEIPKPDVINGLAGATKSTSKGPYHKTNHGFDLLGRIDPAAVRKVSPYADALINLLLDRLT